MSGPPPLPTAAPTPPAPFPKAGVAQIHTDQQYYRELGLERARAGDSNNPGRELAVVQSQIAFCLRKLERYVEPIKAGSKKVSSDDLEKWRRRSRIAGSVRVWEQFVITKQGRRYKIQSECRSVVNDHECPAFEPCNKTVFEQDRKEAFDQEVNRGVRWTVAVLSELLARLEMELERVGWFDEQYGPVNTAERDASARLTGE